MSAVVVWPSGSTDIPPVTSEFNPARKNPVTGTVQPHNGIDLIGFDAIKSPVTGVVTFSGYNGTAGNEVRVREDGTGDIVRLLHNRALNVRTGQRVSQGDTVAWMGSTGQSTGPHCHQETRPGGGSAINPRDWYARRNVAPAGGDITPFPKEGTRLEGAEVFIISNDIPGHNQRGAAWVAVPQGNGKPRATVLFGGDTFPGVPVIRFTNKASWDNFAQGIQWA